MVVLLERGASLALCENNGRVEHFVELGEVEPPAPEGQALVPDAADIGRVGQASRGVDQHVGVLARPRVGRGVVGNRVAESSRAVDLAERVDGADNGIGVAVVREGALQGAHHGDARDGRVDGEEDIVEDDKGEEGARLCDAPGLVAVLAVVPVEVGDDDGVDARDVQGDLVGQGALVDALRDVEGVRERGLAGVGVRDGRRRRVGRELEDGPRGKVWCVQRWAGARHDGRMLPRVCG